MEMFIQLKSKEFQLRKIMDIMEGRMRQIIQGVLNTSLFVMVGLLLEQIMKLTDLPLEVLVQELPLSTSKLLLIKLMVLDGSVDLSMLPMPQFGHKGEKDSTTIRHGVEQLVMELLLWVVNLVRL